MNTRLLKHGDRIEVNRKGAKFVATFLRREGRRVFIEPITPGYTWRQVGSHQIRRRLAGVGGGDAPPCPPASPDSGQSQGVLV